MKGTVIQPPIEGCFGVDSWIRARESSIEVKGIEALIDN